VCVSDWQRTLLCTWAARATQTLPKGHVGFGNAIFRTSRCCGGRRLGHDGLHDILSRTGILDIPTRQRYSRSRNNGLLRGFNRRRSRTRLGSLDWSDARRRNNGGSSYRRGARNAATNRWSDRWCRCWLYQSRHGRTGIPGGHTGGPFSNQARIVFSGRAHGQTIEKVAIGTVKGDAGTTVTGIALIGHDGAKLIGHLQCVSVGMTGPARGSIVATAKVVTYR
jgi:hypothetical protein